MWGPGGLCWMVFGGLFKGSWGLLASRHVSQTVWVRHAVTVDEERSPTAQHSQPIGAVAKAPMEQTCPHIMSYNQYYG